MAMDGSKESPIIYFDDEGNGPNEHVCGRAPAGRAQTAQDWLDHEILTGGVDAKERAVIERLIADIR